MSVPTSVSVAAPKLSELNFCISKTRTPDPPYTFRVAWHFPLPPSLPASLPSSPSHSERQIAISVDSFDRLAKRAGFIIEVFAGSLKGYSLAPFFSQDGSSCGEWHVNVAWHIVKPRDRLRKTQCETILDMFWGLGGGLMTLVGDDISCLMRVCSNCSTTTTTTKKKKLPSERLC